jgi:hypothetical protein
MSQLQTLCGGGEHVVVGPTGESGEGFSLASVFLERVPLREEKERSSMVH